MYTLSSPVPALVNCCRHVVPLLFRRLISMFPAGRKGDVRFSVAPCLVPMARLLETVEVDRWGLADACSSAGCRCCSGRRVIKLERVP